MSRSLEVLLQGLRAGYLLENDDGKVSFRLTDEYRRRTRRPVLSQSFEDDLSKVYRRKRGLPAFFANLVPEGPLRALIESDASLPQGDDIALLAAVGRDLPGAVEIRSASENLEEIEEGTDDGASNGVTRFTAGSADGGLRFSLAGVQLKFSVLRQHDKLTLPVHGHGGEWIAKLDSSTFAQVVENEYAMLEWARAAGFEVPECHILPRSALSRELQVHAPTGGHVLLIRRYDRQGQQRIHQEDLAQAVNTPPEAKYDNIKYQQCALLIKNIAGQEAYLEFVRRLVFIIASGNNDAHLKNWSLVYPDGITAELSPLYDQVCTVAWPEVRADLALSLLGSRDPAQVSEKTFARLAAHAQADAGQTIETVREALSRITTAWRLSTGRDVMPSEHADALFRHWRRVPLLKDHAAAVRLS